MRPLRIIALGFATAFAASCGARTPFDEGELLSGASGTTGASSGVGTTGSGSEVTTTGSSGTNGTGDTTTSGTTVTTSGTGVIPTTGSSGTGPSTTTVTTTGGPGTSGATTVTTTGATVGSTGAGGAFPVTGGVTTTGGTGGIGGSTGAGGSVMVRDAGAPVEAGTPNGLLGVLPGVRPGPACNQCVATSCATASTCSGNPACVAGIACYVANCDSNNQGRQLACATMCFNGNFALLMNAFDATTCVYGSCGAACTRQNRGG